MEEQCAWLNTQKSWYVTQIKELVMPVRGLTEISFHASRRQKIIQFSLEGVINFLEDFYLELHNIFIKKPRVTKHQLSVY